MYLLDLQFYHSELEDSIRDAATAIADDYETEPADEYRREKNTRNSTFGAGTDGAIGRDVSVPLSYLSNTGFRPDPEELCEAIDKWIDDLYTMARDAFIRDHPGIQDSLWGKAVCYSNLEEAGRHDLAETFNEYQDAALEDEFVTFRIAAFFYNPDNRNPGRKTCTGTAELQFWIGAFLGDGCQVGPGPKLINHTCYEAHVTIDSPLRPYTGPRSTLDPKLLAAMQAFEKAAGVPEWTPVPQCGYAP